MVVSPFFMLRQSRTASPGGWPGHGRAQRPRGAAGGALLCRQPPGAGANGRAPDRTRRGALAGREGSGVVGGSAPFFACCLCPVSGVLPEEYEDKCPVSRIYSENTNEMRDTGHFSDLSRF